jgi:hypothetical protein
MCGHLWRNGRVEFSFLVYTISKNAQGKVLPDPYGVPVAEFSSAQFNCGLCLSDCSDRRGLVPIQEYFSRALENKLSCVLPVVYGLFRSLPGDRRQADRESFTMRAVYFVLKQLP